MALELRDEDADFSFAAAELIAFAKPLAALCRKFCEDTLDLPQSDVILP